MPEQEAAYPEFSMFGELPASGFYARHVACLHLKNVRILYKGPDFRTACIFDDIKDLTLKHVDARGKTALPVILLNNAANPGLENIQLEMPLDKGIRQQ